MATTVQLGGRRLPAVDASGRVLWSVDQAGRGVYVDAAVAARWREELRQAAVAARRGRR